LISLENGTPRKDDCIRGVENPYEHERTGRPEPTDKAKAEDTHENAGHFNDVDVFEDE
jgi:hypothetical protein